MIYVIVLGFLFMAYFAGYVVGYHHCFDYLKGKLEDYRREHETDRGPDESV